MTNAIREAAYRVAEASFVAAMMAGALVGTWWPLWLAAVPVSLVVIGVRGYRWRVVFDATWDRWHEALLAAGKARREGYRLARDDRASASEELEEVLAAERWSPQARDAIRACISQLRHGDYRHHISEARAALGLDKRGTA